MCSKRDHSDLDDGEIPEPVPKRAKQPSSSKSRQHQNSGTDSTSGQKYVFTNYGDATTIPAGEESDFEDDTDAMAYLMSVRQESCGIPHLLVAPKVQIGPQLPAGFQKDAGGDGDGVDDKDEYEDTDQVDRSIYRNGMGDPRGWYEDGAYMAAPESDEDDYYDPGGASDEDEVVSEKAIHEAYFASISGQFGHVRDTLNSTPPDAESRLPPSTRIEAPPFGRNSSTTAIWSRLVRDTDPHPLQLALMSKDSVLRVLRIILGGKFLRKGQTVEERTSRWLWGLLARLPEKGELNYAEIGWIRDLGRRAVLLGTSLAEMAALREAVEDGLGVNEGVDGSSSDEDVMADADTQEDEGAVDSPSGETHDTIPSGVAPEDGNIQQAAEVPPRQNTNSGRPQKPGQEQGEIQDEEEDVAMDIASNSSMEEGEASDNGDGLENAKTRLLAQLDVSAAEDERITAEEAARERARANSRATLNMILTVAGEFYGQRDLLEFREPFVGM